MKKVCIVCDSGSGRLGGHCTQYAFCGLPGVKICALSDANKEADWTSHKRTGAERFYSDYKEMITKEKPDIAVLCSRLPGEHYPQIKFALEHHCHVFCEKPAADDLEKADDLIRLAESTHCKVQIAHLARFAPAFREMKRLIDEGQIGRILSCYMRGKEESRGGGEDMMVLGTHIMDVACYLLGDPLSVYSDIRVNGDCIRKGEYLPTEEPLGLCTGDEVFSHFRFPNGVNGIFESRRNTVPKTQIRRLGIVISGTEGALSIRYEGERQLHISRNFPSPQEDEAHFEVVTLPPEETIPGAAAIDYTAWNLNRENPLHRYFTGNNRRAAWDLLQCIHGDTTPRADLRSAAISLEMILGSYRSALEKRVVSLPLEDRTHPLLAD